MKHFITKNGSLISRVKRNNKFVWEGKNLHFEDKKGSPVNSIGEPVQGKMLNSSIIPLDRSTYQLERERLAEELFDHNFSFAGQGILSKGDIYVDFKENHAVRVDLSDGDWYGRFELYFKDATADAIINVAHCFKKDVR